MTVSNSRLLHLHHLPHLPPPPPTHTHQPPPLPITFRQNKIVALCWCLLLGVPRGWIFRKARNWRRSPSPVFPPLLLARLLDIKAALAARINLSHTRSHSHGCRPRLRCFRPLEAGGEWVSAGLLGSKWHVPRWKQAFALWATKCYERGKNRERAVVSSVQGGACALGNAHNLCALPVSEISPTLPLKRFECSSHLW